MASPLIPIENMDADTRTFIHRRFPYYTSNDTCLYINGLTGVTCGAPSVRDEYGVLTCACPSHLSDFRLGLSVRIWVLDNQSETNERHVHSGFVVDDIPMYIEPAAECSVCTESVNLLSLPCRHVTCISCYNQLQTKKCPMCRCEIVHFFVRRIPPK